MKIISIVFLCLCVFLCLWVFYFVVSYWIFRKKKNEKRKSENEDLVWIDTSDAAEYFATLLNNNLTFFLNGEWGAGKTEYLKNVEKNARKKFIYVNLWNMKDERSVISIGFSALHNWMNYIYRILLIGCVVVSILLTPAINIGLGKFMSHLLGDSLLIDFIVPVASIVSLFVAVWQFFKYKSDDVYYKIFQWPISEYFLRKKILVIDDFDRISETNQEGAYKLFNCINGNLPIIFVGDYSKLKDNGKDKYLQKIIDQKVELPYSLHPQNIWKEYFEILKDQFSCVISPSIINIFIKDNRNLRERKMFHHYVLQELEVRDKKDYVQINQQLVIIYLYLFYPIVYSKLVGGEDISKSLDAIGLNELSSILENSKGYPRSFSNQRQGYFLYEKILTLTEGKAVELLQKSNLESVMIEEGSHNDDFFEYVVRNFSEIDPTMQQNLLDAALINIYNNKDSALVSAIIKFKNNEVTKDLDSISVKTIVDTWNNILNKFQFDVSQQLYFFEKYVKINFAKLSDIYSNIDLGSDEFLKGKKKNYYFLTYLAATRTWQRFNWPETYWKSLNVIFSEEVLDYLYILELLHLIDVDYENKKITAYKNLYNDLRGCDLLGAREAFEKIEPKLEEIGEKGFVIEYEDRKIVNYT